MSRRTKLNGIEPFHARPATFYSYNRGRGHSKNRRFPKSGHSSFKTLYDGLRTKSDRKSAFRRDSGPSSEEDEWPRRDRSAVVGRRPGWEVDQLVSDSDEEDNQGGRSRNRTKNTALINRFLGKKNARTHSHDDEELYELLKQHKHRLNAIERSIREATELRERGWQDTVRELRAVQAETEQKVFDLEEQVQSSEGRGTCRSGTRSQQWRERVPATSQQRDDMSDCGRANNHRLRHGPGNFVSEDVGVLPQRGHDLGPHDMEARIRLASQRARELEENLLIEPSSSLPRERHVSFEEQLCADEFASEANNPRELRPDNNQFSSDLFHTPSRPCAPSASFQLSPSANPIAPAAPVADHYCGSPSFPYDEELCAKRVVSHFPTLPLNEEGRDSSYTFACLSLLNRSIQRSKNLIESEEGSGEKPSSLLQSIANMTSVFDFDQDVPPREGEKGNGNGQVNGTENVFVGECPWEDDEAVSQQGRVNGSILLDSSARTPPLERAFNKTITLMKAHHTAFADPNVPTVWRAALEQSTRQLIDVDPDYREDQPPQHSFYDGSVCGEVGYGTNNPHPVGDMVGCNDVQRDRRFDELLDSLEHGAREEIIKDDHLSERNQNSELYAGQGDVGGQYRQDNRHPNWEGSVRGGDVNSSRRSRHYGERSFFDQRHFNPDNNPWGMNTPQLSEIGRAPSVRGQGNDPFL